MFFDSNAENCYLCVLQKGFICKSYFFEACVVHLLLLNVKRGRRPTADVRRSFVADETTTGLFMSGCLLQQTSLLNAGKSDNSCPTLTLNHFVKLIITSMRTKIYIYIYHKVLNLQTSLIVDTDKCCKKSIYEAFEEHNFTPN